MRCSLVLAGAVGAFETAITKEPGGREVWRSPTSPSGQNLEQWVTFTDSQAASKYMIVE